MDTENRKTRYGYACKLIEMHQIVLFNLLTRRAIRRKELRRRRKYRRLLNINRFSLKSMADVRRSVQTTGKS